MNGSDRHRVIFGVPKWELGGPCVFVERAVSGLRTRGHDASILITEHDTALVQEILTLRPPPGHLPVELLPSGRRDSWGSRWLALERYIEERAPCTYVMISDWRNNVIAPRLSSRVKVIGLIQADYALEREQAVRLGPWWQASVAVSGVIQFGVAHEAPHLASRLVTIDNAVPLPGEIPARDHVARPLRLAYVGVLRPGQKRIRDLLAVAGELQRREIDAVLTLIGDGPIRSDLECEGAELVRTGRLRFTGQLSRDEVDAALSEQDVVIMASEFEGLSLALLEAMSLGCIPLITDIVSHAEVVEDGVNGYRVPIGDIDAFARRVAELAVQPEQRARLSAAAAATVRERYDFEQALTKWEQLIDAVTERTARGELIRSRGGVSPPPHYVGGIGILPGEHGYSARFVNMQPWWPDPARGPSRVRPSEAPARSLAEHRILVALPSGSRISGVDVFSHHLVRELRRAGLTASILSPEQPDRLHPSEGDPDVPYEGPMIPWTLGWRRKWRLMADYIAQRPTIYIPNYDYDYSCVSAILPGSVRVIPIAHGDDPAHYDHVARLAPAVDAVVGVSTTILAQLSELVPVLDGRMHHIPYGVVIPDGIAARHPSRPLRIVYSGRLQEAQKRAGDLVHVAHELDRRGIDFELSIIGDGEERETIAAALTELVLARRVRLLGQLSSEQALRVIAESDVLLLTSGFEGLSVAMLEAMAHGTVPVISAIRSGVPEVIVDGGNGLLAPIGAIERFADHLEALAGDRPRLAQMAHAAHETVVSRELSVERMAQRYHELFEVVLASSIEREPGPLVPPIWLRDQLTPKGRLVGRMRGPARKVGKRLRDLGL